MNKSQFEEALNYIFAEYEKPSVRVQLVWWDQFKDIEKDLFVRAARRVVARKCYGAPKAFDLWEELRAEMISDLPESLTMSPSEALVCRGKPKLLCRDAAEFADRVVLPPDGQYDSLEDLEKAQRIYTATWEREFKARFARKQAEALSAVQRGAKPREAILNVLNMTTALKALPPANGTAKIVHGLIEMTGK